MLTIYIQAVRSFSKKERRTLYRKLYYRPSLYDLYGTKALLFIGVKKNANNTLLIKMFYYELLSEG